MKKVKLYPTLVISFILSSFSFTSSALEETFTYGSPPSPFGIDASLKQVTLPSGSGMSGASVGRSPEVIATIEKKVAADQAAYCKANNYPTNVPFCAGYKRLAEQDCNTAKSGAPIDRQVCIDDVGYRGTVLTNAQCGSVSPSRTSGTFSWNYTFQGKFYGFRANIPAQSYDEFSWHSDQLACERIISNAVTHIQANCRTQADYAIHEKCN